MTEQNAESNLEAGTQAQAQISEAGSQESSDSVTALKAELKRVQDDLRAVQGKMDKDAQRIESNLDKRLAQLGVQLTPEQKLQNRVLDLEERLVQADTQASVEPKPEVREAQTLDIAKIKQAYNDIDFNSPQVLQAVSKNINNEDGLLAALGKIKVSGTAKPQPTAASVASPSGSTQSGATMESLQAELDALRSRSPHDWKANQAKRQEIIAKMREIDGT